MAELSSSQVLAQTNQAAAKINESLSKYIQCFTLDLP